MRLVGSWSDAPLVGVEVVGRVKGGGGGAGGLSVISNLGGMNGSFCVYNSGPITKTPRTQICAMKEIANAPVFCAEWG
jgi:hypothetical protein